MTKVKQHDKKYTAVGNNLHDLYITNDNFHFLINIKINVHISEVKHDLGLKRI